MMTKALFTILLPINRPPALLPFAVASVLAQSEPRFRLCILCDGAPAETVESAKAFAASDPRIDVFAFDKGERHGEAHRHHILQTAQSDYVAQIGDDDLWFPDYLAELAKLLSRVDFGNLPQVDIRLDGKMELVAASLDNPVTRARMLAERWNIFGPTFAGYRLEAYRRLPVGWSPAPADIWTDLFMWRKFLTVPDLHFGTYFSIQAVKFYASIRSAMSMEARADEIRDVAERLKSPLERCKFQIEALQACAAIQVSDALELIRTTNELKETHRTEMQRLEEFQNGQLAE